MIFLYILKNYYIFFTYAGQILNKNGNAINDNGGRTSVKIAGLGIFMNYSGK